MSLKRRVFEIVEVASPDDRASQIFDTLIVALILLNVAAFVVGTMPALQERFGAFFYYFEVFSVAVFSIEYALRLWSCTAEPTRSSITGRLKFASRPLILIDLLAILPFYLPFLGIDLRSLRVLRVFRIFRVLKLARYSAALQLLGEAISKRKEELVLAVGLQAVLILFASTIVYYIENPIQPEAFSSIPASMWWGIATLSTVGYGDMYPLTALGRFFGAVIALLGIGMFALPTGILGAAFTETIRRRHGETECPECGTRVGSNKNSV